MHRHQHDPPPVIGARALVGVHPRDGGPVACWVVHPRDADASDALVRYTAALGLGGLDDPALRAIPEHRASLTAAAGWATLWVGDATELVAPHDPAWLSALLDRGWAMVVLGWSPDLADADHAGVMAYLTSGAGARVGVVRAA